jgi:hypothetical protein
LPCCQASAGAPVVIEGADGLEDGASINKVATVAAAAVVVRRARVVKPAAAPPPQRHRQRGMSTSAPEAPAPAQPGGPSRPFILRPVATTLLMIALLLAGLVA